jgi:DeoR/GlpR family transcriptional regulator of sugar metabolism
MMTSRTSEREGQLTSQGQAVGQRERQERIREQVIANGFVRAEQLAEEFSVALITIHRDLDWLQQQGWLRKVRGGATARPSSLFHGDIHYRTQAMGDAKEQIAQCALKLVEPGQSIMLDESTTGLYLARYLPSRGPITVITHFLSLVKQLAGEPGIDLIALGGSYLPAYDAFFGLLTAKSIHSMRADTLFMSTTAITGGFCYHQSQETTLIKRALMDVAERSVLLVDHTKFSKRALFQLVPLTAFSLIIVDNAIVKEDLAEVRDCGATVYVAGSSHNDQELLELFYKE